MHVYCVPPPQCSTGFIEWCNLEFILCGDVLLSDPPSPCCVCLSLYHSCLPTPCSTATTITTGHTEKSINHDGRKYMHGYSYMCTQTTCSSACPVCLKTHFIRQKKQQAHEHIPSRRQLCFLLHWPLLLKPFTFPVIFAFTVSPFVCLRVVSFLQSCVGLHAE